MHGYCALTGVLGTPTELGSAIGGACITATTPTLSDPAVPFGTKYFGSWVNSPSTVADTINNLWLAVCDILTGSTKTVVEAGVGTTVTSSTTGNVTTYTVSAEGGSITIEEPCACGGGGIASNADVYAYVDITSGPYNIPGGVNCGQDNRLALVQAVKQWHTDYANANPSYTGQLYIFILSAEDYINYPNGIKNGNIPGAQFLNLTTAVVDVAAQPTNWNTGSWVAPTGLLFIAFVNEASNNYHCQNSPANFNTCPGGNPQPTPIWTSNYNTFVNDYNTHWNFFQGVVYPANDNNINAGNFCLQAFAATNNIASITALDLSTALGPINYATLGAFVGPIANPYVSNNQGLWDYGWASILDKSVGPCVPGSPSISFTAQEFAADLNGILNGGGGGGCDCASIVDSWDPLTQTLALRSITSCSLDISVDETGCIAIESTGSKTTPLSVRITPSGSNLTASVSGAVGSVTYEWEMADIIFGSTNHFFQFTTATNIATVGLSTTSVVPSFEACNSINAGKIGMAKVIVTDSDGRTAIDTFLLLNIVCA